MTLIANRLVCLDKRPAFLVLSQNEVRTIGEGLNEPFQIRERALPDALVQIRIARLGKRRQHFRDGLRAKTFRASDGLDERLVLDHALRGLQPLVER